VPARHDPNAKAETMLARVRMARGVTQEELADAIRHLPPYLPPAGAQGNGQPRHPVSSQRCTRIGVELDVLIEDEWREWMVFDAQRRTPPQQTEFWRRPFAPGQGHLDDLREQGRLR